MKELTVETGVVTYSINGGKCTLSFNPTDSVFVERLFSVFEVLDKKQESYNAEMEKDTSNREKFELARKMDEEMRDLINEALGTDICSALCGEMSMYALADGLPVWANLLFAIIDEINTTSAREMKQTNSRIDKYLKKYHR